jgi:hypothetical protein
MNMAQEISQHPGWKDQLTMQQIANLCDPWVKALGDFLEAAEDMFPDCERVRSMAHNLETFVVNRSASIRGKVSRILLEKMFPAIDPFFNRIAENDMDTIRDMRTHLLTHITKKIRAGTMTKEQGAKEFRNHAVSLLDEKYHILTQHEPEDTPQMIAEDKADLKKMWNLWTAMCGTMETAATSLKLPRSILNTSFDVGAAIDNQSADIDLRQTGEKMKKAMTAKEKRQIKKLVKGKTQAANRKMIGSTLQATSELKRAQRKAQMFRKREARKKANEAQRAKEQARLEAMKRRAMESINGD